MSDQQSSRKRKLENNNKSNTHHSTPSSTSSSSSSSTNSSSGSNNNDSSSSSSSGGSSSQKKSRPTTILDYWAQQYHKSRQAEIETLLLSDRKPKFNDLQLVPSSSASSSNENDQNSPSSTSTTMTTSAMTAMTAMTSTVVEGDDDISIMETQQVTSMNKSTRTVTNTTATATTTTTTAASWTKKASSSSSSSHGVNNNDNNNNSNYKSNGKSHQRANTMNRTSSHGADQWDSLHVKLPCSSQNTFSSPYNNKKSKWYLIETLLKQRVSNVIELQDLIGSIKSCGHQTQQQQQQNYASSTEMVMLFDFFQSYCPQETRQQFFARILPWMQKTALRLPELFVNGSIPLLRKQKEATVKLNALQIACLMCHAFFCSFPRRDRSANTRRDHEYYTFPSVNFTELYRGVHRVDKEKMMAAKLETIVQYFNQVSQTNEATLIGRSIEFHRRVLFTNMHDDDGGDSGGITTIDDEQNDVKDTILSMWANSAAKLVSCSVFLNGTIEDDVPASQIDFANKMIGGGVLGHGCVQEEIRFLINTECIISRLFTEEFDDNECVIIRGAKRFSKYLGYSDSFRYDGPYVYADGSEDHKEEIVAIDALDFAHRGMFRSKTDQYKPEWIQRELNKAYCSMQKLSYDPYNHDLKVATGHWGGGAFSRDRELKAVIQLMAASQAQRTSVDYFAYGDEEFVKKFDPMYSNLVCIEATVGELYSCLMEYRTKRVQTRQKQKQLGIAERMPSVLDFIFSWFVAETGDDLLTGDGVEGAEVDSNPTAAPVVLDPITQCETVLDTSTTGLDIAQDDVVQVATTTVTVGDEDTDPTTTTKNTTEEMPRE